MKIKDVIISIVIGIITGTILTLALFYYGKHSTELIYGNSTFFSRLMVWIICIISAVASESFVDTSSREVAIDMIIALFAVLLCIDKHSINSYEMLDSIKGVMLPILITVGFASFFSEPVSRWANKFIEKPMHKE